MFVGVRANQMMGCSRFGCRRRRQATCLGQEFSEGLSPHFGACCSAVARSVWAARNYQRAAVFDALHCSIQHAQFGRVAFVVGGIDCSNRPWAAVASDSARHLRRQRRQQRQRRHWHSNVHEGEVPLRPNLGVRAAHGIANHHAHMAHAQIPFQQAVLRFHQVIAVVKRKGSAQAV